MKTFFFLAFLSLCSCQSSIPPTTVRYSEKEVLEAIVQIMDPNYVATNTSGLVLSANQQTYLRNVSFYDPYSMLQHHLFIDKVMNFESRQVERSYMNFVGKVDHTEIITLPEEEFWEPWHLLAKYYVRFGRFPVETELSVPILERLMKLKEGRIGDGRIVGEHGVWSSRQGCDPAGE